MQSRACWIQSIAQILFRQGGGWALMFHFLVLKARAQETGAVAGLLVEGWDGKPLGGAAVTVRGTTLATTSDAAGRFHMGENAPGDQAVRFSDRATQPRSSLRCVCYRVRRPR